MMTNTIEFFKRYTRQSRSPWDDVSRVVMIFQPDSKQGIYLNLSESGINGMSVSKELQARLPPDLFGQYIDAAFTDIVLHLFCEQIEESCNTHVKRHEFRSIFMVDQNT